RIARRRMNGSATAVMVMPVCVRTSRPTCSRALWRASALMTVASMPMWSAVVRSIPAALASPPRMMFPPPTTMASAAPRSATDLYPALTRRVRVAQVRLGPPAPPLREFLHPPLDALGKGRLGPAFVPGQVRGDLPLSLEHVRRDVLGAEVGRVREGDLHRQL